MKYFEKANRSIIKALTFRSLILVTDSIVIFLLTKRLEFTIGIMLLTNITSTLMYFLHERAWNNVHWGKHTKK